MRYAQFAQKVAPLPHNLKKPKATTSLFEKGKWVRYTSTDGRRWRVRIIEVTNGEVVGEVVADGNGAVGHYERYRFWDGQQHQFSELPV